MEIIIMGACIESYGKSHENLHTSFENYITHSNRNEIYDINFHRDTQTSTEIHTLLQRYTNIHRDTQTSTEIHKHPQRYTNFHRDTQTSTNFHRYTKTSTEIHKHPQTSTEIHKFPQGYTKVHRDTCNSRHINFSII